MGVTDNLISERELLATVVDYAEAHSWKVYHVFDMFQHAKRSSPGFPDLVLVRAGELVFAELKSEKGRLTDPQNEWFQALSEVVGGQVCVWRPSDWEQIVWVLA